MQTKQEFQLENKIESSTKLNNFNNRN